MFKLFYGIFLFVVLTFVCNGFAVVDVRLYELFNELRGEVNELKSKVKNLEQTIGDLTNQGKQTSDSLLNLVKELNDLSDNEDKVIID